MDSGPARQDQETDTVFRGLVEMPESDWRQIEPISRGPPAPFRVIAPDTGEPCLVSLRVAGRHPPRDAPKVDSFTVEIEMVVKTTRESPFDQP